MPAIHLSLDIPCTPEEAAWFAAVLVFLDDFARDPAALPGPELDGLFGEHPRETLLGILRLRRDELAADVASAGPLSWNLARTRAREALAHLPNE